jgi:hypothetical protein
MKRFSDVKLPMKKSSDIAKHKVSHSSIYDRRTGKTGVLLWVRTFKWKSNQNVVVDGGYWCGSLCAGRGDFYVTLIDGRWIVEKFDLKVIS